MIVGKRLFWLLLAGLISACSTRSVDTEYTRCVYPDSPRTPAPAFLCQASIPGFPITVLRSSEPSDLAVSDRIESVFQDQVQQWASAWSLEWVDQPDEQMRALTFLLSWLQDNGRVVRSRVSPKGYLWLLVAIPVTSEELQALTLQELNDASTD